MLKYWGFLCLAIACEVAGTLSLKLSAGFSRLMPGIFVVVFYGLSFFLLSKALLRIEVGVAYAVWSAVGVVGITLVSMALFGESLTLAKAFSFLLIIAGVIGLKLSSG